LGVSRKHVSAIVNGRAPVTPDIAMRLAAVFSTEPEVWVNLKARIARSNWNQFWNQRPFFPVTNRTIGWN